MKYTVFENKTTHGRFFSSYTEKDETGSYDIIGHCNSIEDAQALCDVNKEINEHLFLQTLPVDLRDLAKSFL